ncbi:MAG: oligoendopeptidase pepF/M3 family, partial [Tardiphaga sp.]|nr:oligoendopeptidase pepF/M3 family [Tardiphaga sp.]
MPIVKKPVAKKAVAKPTAAARGKPAPLPEWNLADLYTSIDAPEIARDLDKLDADCAAFEANYKGRLAEETAKQGGGAWLAGAVKSFEAIDDLAGR